MIGDSASFLTAVATSLAFLREAACTLFDNHLLEGAWPEDVHDRVDPDQILSEASQPPDESAPANTVRRVLTIPLLEVHHNTVDEAVDLDTSEDHEDQSEVVEGSSLGILAERNFELILREVLLRHPLVNKEAKDDECYQEDRVAGLHDHVGAVIA